MTLEEKATNHETWKHINRVRYYITKVVKNLLDRAQDHDQSKLYPPEVSLFTEYTPQLADLTFGTPEYEEVKNRLGPALEHHYAKNRHHPEHFKNGIEDMNLLDLVEMFCDWKAASERHNDGNLRKSIDTNAERFKMTPQLRRIFENTIEVLE